jgi:hypothetical protein
MSINNEEYKNEWLQFIEFIRRKYGNTSSDKIRYHYNESSNRSVAQYYSSKYTNSNINSNAKLPQLLKDTKFIELFNLNNPVEISKFTEIYNDTDYLMNSLNNKTDNLYIKCNPVDDNGVSIDASNNTYGPSLNSLNSMLTEASSFFSPEMLYNNIGLQVIISIIFVGVIYGIGNFMFVVYPSNYSKKRRHL